MWPFVRRGRLVPVERLHDRIAALARRRPFFTDLGVADTFEGRFELLALHLLLVLRRLAELPPPAREVAQDLTNVAFRKLDQGLREIGIGDLAVPKRMKTLARAFYGRAAAYDAALGSGEGAKLVETLRRNVLGGQEGDVDGLARHVEALQGRLASFDLEAILARDLDERQSERIALGEETT
jgi:cytochrome b pre-mRNA-processing protein 3